MSDKMPLYAVDKRPVTVRVSAEVYVKLERLAGETGFPVAAIAAMAIGEKVADRPFTVDDLRRVNEIVSENIQRRDSLKARKGVL